MHLIAEEGPHRGSTLNLDVGGEWTIGRDPEASDFVIEDKTVSRKAARLSKTSEGVFLKNLSKVNPTLVNDEEPLEPVLLKEGDRIQVGNTVFLYSEQARGGYDDIFGDVVEDEDVTPTPAETPKKEAAPPEEPQIPPSPPRPEMAAYDTIFEDTGADEAIPFDLASEPPLMLKVIAGPNAGAEIGLEKGKVYTIGKDADASDIVFQDMSVSRHHAKLSVNDDGIIDIEDLGSKNGTAINGVVITERSAVTPQDLVALGTTIFMIIDREAPQETIFSPVAQQSRGAGKEVEAAPIEEERDWKKEPIPMKYLIMWGSAAAIFLIMFVSFFSLFKSKGIEIVQKEPVSEIQEALAKFSDVQFSYNPGSGKLFLAGHVLTPVEYQEMRYRLGQINFVLSIEDNVVIDEGVWRMMNDVISNTPAWRGVSVHSPSAGKFVVAGYVATPDEATQLSEDLTVNFPYLDRLDNQVIIQEVLEAQVQAMINASRLGAVTFQLTGGELILMGRYSDAMGKEFEALIKHLNAVKGIASVKNVAIAVSPSDAGIDLSEHFQVSGTSMYDGRGYSAVLNGKIYTLGDQVDGMKITSIEPSKVLLEKDGLRYKIDYRR